MNIIVEAIQHKYSIQLDPTKEPGNCGNYSATS